MKESICAHPCLTRVNLEYNMLNRRDVEEIGRYLRRNWENRDESGQYERELRNLQGNSKQAELQETGRQIELLKVAKAGLVEKVALLREAVAQ